MRTSGGSTEKVYKEFMLYAIGRNINKYHRFLHHKIEKFEGKRNRKPLNGRKSSEKPEQGAFVPQNKGIGKKVRTLQRLKALKKPGFYRVLSFLTVRVQKTVLTDSPIYVHLCIDCVVI